MNGHIDYLLHTHTITEKGHSQNLFARAALSRTLTKGADRGYNDDKKCLERTAKMRSKKAMVFLLAALLLTGWGCGGAAAPVMRPGAGEATAAPQSHAEIPGVSPASEPALVKTAEAFAVTDMAGREVTLNGTPGRVVALSPSACEIVFALGAEEALLGRSEGCDYPWEAADLPVYSLDTEAETDRLLAEQPDLVLVDELGPYADAAARLETAGVPLVFCGANTLEETYASLRLLGEIFGAGGQAEDLVRAMEEVFTALGEAPIVGGKTIYFEVTEPPQLRTAGRGTYLDDIARLMGLQNCFEDREGWALVTEAEVAARDPDFILTVVPFSGEGAAPEEELVIRDAWQDMGAVQALNVIAMPENELSRFGPRLADGALLLYDFVIEALTAEE